MNRVPLPDVNALDGWRRAQYHRFPSNLTLALTLLVERLASQFPAMANALRASGLDPALREAVILRVASRQSSAYERFQHLGQAKEHGWSDLDIDRIEHGPFDLLPLQTQTVLPFVDALIDGPDVSEAQLSSVRAVVDDATLVTIIAVVGHYMTVARIVAVLGVPLDPTPDPWTGEH